MRLDLVVGPNGAGKSTFVEHTLQTLTPWSVFVNADVIAKQRWPQDPETHSYDAARVAAQIRSALICAGETFIAETVFSHPSKLDLIREANTAGYTVILHVLIIPETLAVQRVMSRVDAGGHSVPEDKIRKRYQRLWPLVAQAIALTDTAIIYDNAQYDGPREVARFIYGTPIGVRAWPVWTPPALSNLT